MGNPLNSFLQGMYAVDRMETNKVNRALAEENQSRVRKMWKREDDEYEKLKLERYRGEKLAELEATMQGIVMELPEGSPLFNDQHALMQEAHKRMVAKDPSFGEHVALAHGLDPAAGSLVDKKNPVSGFGLAYGKGTFFELLTKTGEHAPYTDNRTSAGTDPVTFRQPGMQELIGIYGSGVMQNKFMIAGLLRSMVGGDQVTGNALASQDKGQAGAKSPDTKQEPTAQLPPTPSAVEETDTVGSSGTSVDLLSREEQANLSMQEQHNLAEKRRQETMDERADATGPAKYHEPANVTIFDAGKNSEVGLIRGLSIAADSIADGISHVPGALGLTKRVAQNAFVDFSYAAANAVTNATTSKEGTLSRESAYNNKQERKRKAAVEKAAENYAVRTEPANNLVAVPDANRYNAKNIANDPQAAADAVAIAPILAPKAVAPTAQAVLGAQGSKRPSLVQMANAVSLAKMNLITGPQLMQYAATGSLTGPAKRNLEKVTDAKSGITTIFDMDRGVPISRVRTGQGETPDVPTDKENFEYAVDLLQDYFVDRDGNADKRRTREAVRQFNRVKRTLESAFFGGNKIAIDQSFADDFEQGARWQNNYEDPRSKLNPMRWIDSRELGRQTGTLGYMAVQMNVSGQNDFNNFATEWGIEFGEYATNRGMNEEERVQMIHSLETRAQEVAKELYDGDMYKARKKVREATVEYLTKNRQ